MNYARKSIRLIFLTTVIAAGALLAFAPTVTLTAQEIGEIDEDELFGGGDAFSGESTDEADMFGSSDDSFITEIEDDSEGDVSPEDELLVTDEVVIGGRFNFEYDVHWGWNDPETIFEQKFDTRNVVVDLFSTVYFDARPDEDFRVFGKGSLYYPFMEDDTHTLNDILRMDELFADFSFKDRLFFRAGKQSINWGVGYYFSPANLINIGTINPFEPEEELEGPLALKAHFPIGVNNLYLYTFAQDFDEIDNIAIAPKAEFVLGTIEFGLGGYYQYDYAPAGMFTVTTDISDFHLFGEAVVHYGSNKTFVREEDITPESPFGLGTEERDDTFYFNSTAGVRYTHIDDNDNFNISVSGQYYFNGFGYSDPSILNDNQNGVAYLISQESISTEDLIRTGKHYGAAGFMWSEMFGSPFEINIFWIGNMSDLSGIVKASVGLKEVFNLINVSIGGSYYYGDEGDEFSQKGNGITIDFETSFGTGKF